MSDMVERIGEALRKECLAIFGATWSNDVAWRLAQAAIEAMPEHPAPDTKTDWRAKYREILNENKRLWCELNVERGRADGHREAWRMETLAGAKERRSPRGVEGE